MFNRCFNLQDLEDVIKYFKLDNFIVDDSTDLGVVHLTFCKVHWYSFIKKYRIKKFKNYLPQVAPMGIWFDVRTAK